MSGIMDGINEMIIEEVILGALGHIEDKSMIKEKSAEFLGYLDKLDDKMLLMITRVNGKVCISVDKKTNVQFEKSPSFINVEDMLNRIAGQL